MWEISGRHRRPERSPFLKNSVQRRHTTPLRPMPQRTSIFRRAHKRAARTATTPRQAAKVQPALRAYATKGGPARNCIASGRPDKQASTPRKCAASRNDQRPAMVIRLPLSWAWICCCLRGCDRPVFAPPPIPEMTKPTSPPAQLRARVDKKCRHPGRKPGSSQNRPQTDKIRIHGAGTDPKTTQEAF